MSAKERQKAVVAVVTCLVLAVLVVQGCKKSEPETPPAPAEPAKDTAAKLETESASAVAKATEQTSCPVMGNPINKDVCTDYKGQKVYFCCPACVDKFKAEPEKYLSKLPQFKQ